MNNGLPIKSAIHVRRAEIDFIYCLILVVINKIYYTFEIVHINFTKRQHY